MPNDASTRRPGAAEAVEPGGARAEAVEPGGARAEAVEPGGARADGGAACCAAGRESVTHEAHAGAMGSGAMGSGAMGSGAMGSGAMGSGAGGGAGAGRARIDAGRLARRVAAPPSRPATHARIRLPGGIFRMGTDAPTFPADGEAPARRVRVRAFAIDACAVTNERFAAFIAATGYVTDAERFGWSFVFHAFVPPGTRVSGIAGGAPWWRAVLGACWRAPEGPQSDVAARGDHPVVHVSWRDAAAFAAWAGGRLPSEAEWEYAARGGLEGATFPWGDDLTPGGRHLMNVWQGVFPERDDAADGYAGTAPVDAYPPNGFGVFGMTGNTWEWCADHFTAMHPKGAQDDPRGPAAGPGRVMKGGSYLCHASYCNRYRVAARTFAAEDDGLGHVGFRVAYPG